MRDAYDTWARNIHARVSSQHEQDPSNDRESGNPDNKPDKTICWVHGIRMRIPQTYDPETYDRDGRMPWTPEPEPYDPDTYATWGRKHFGDDWYEQRKTMLEGKNIYDLDPVYRLRQVP